MLLGLQGSTSARSPILDVIKYKAILLIFRIIRHCGGYASNATRHSAGLPKIRLLFIRRESLEQISVDRQMILKSFETAGVIRWSYPDVDVGSTLIRGIYFETTNGSFPTRDTDDTMWHGESLYPCSSMLNRDGVITVSHSVVYVRKLPISSSRRIHFACTLSV